MADRYLTEADVDVHLGAEIRRAYQNVRGADLMTMVERATAFVQGFLRNSGYTCPVTALGVVGDESVKMAVAAALREMICSIPELSIPLPADWTTRIEKRCFEGILSGDLQVNLPQSSIAAPGGWKFSDSTLKPQRASREDLKVY